MNKNFLNDDVDYWNVANTIKNLYLSDGSIVALLDFERVLDQIDLYAFKNWELGELVQGPEIGRYTVTCTFLWLKENMPDPSGAKRLLPFDCTVKYKLTSMEVPTKIKSYDDFKPGTKKPKLIEKDIWLVEITMPKDLISDVHTGSVELEGQDIDLEELNMAYEKDLDQEEAQSEDTPGET
jgi:hypothetical protein